MKQKQMIEIGIQIWDHSEAFRQISFQLTMMPHISLARDSLPVAYCLEY